MISNEGVETHRRDAVACTRGIFFGPEWLEFLRAAFAVRSAVLVFAGMIVLALPALPSVAQAAPRAFRDCPDCPEMVAIPGGRFTMGGQDDEVGLPDIHKGRSVPEHSVTVGRFALAKDDVTRAQYAAFVAASGYQTKDDCRVLHRPEEARTGVDQYSWRNPNFSQTDQDPVVCVSWSDAKAYADWLSAKTHRVYRLPTEAEWEFAARAGSQKEQFWDRGEHACLYGNLPDRTFETVLGLEKFADRMFPCTDGYVFTSPAGRFRPNPWGLHDMLGNVWQWVEDCWQEDFQGAPADGSAWMKGDCRRHASRGGSWYYYLWRQRIRLRFWGETEDRDADLGFRVARSM